MASKGRCARPSSCASALVESRELLTKKLVQNSFALFSWFARRKQGGWRFILLPLIAVRKRTYDLGYEKSARKRGEQLRPGLNTAKQLRYLRGNTINPDFELYYQQGHTAGPKMTIKAKHFTIGDPLPAQDLPVILSIDPGQRGGPTNSFSVIQAWCPAEDNHYLLDQWREQCSYERLRDRYRYFARHFRPSVALIEATANGPALISDAGRKPFIRVIEVAPDNRSKRRGSFPMCRSSAMAAFIFRKVRFWWQISSRSSSNFRQVNSTIKLTPPRSISIG